MNERTRITLAIVITAVILFTWQPLIHVIERSTGLQLLPPPTTQVATTQSTTEGTNAGVATTAPGGNSGVSPAWSTVGSVAVSQPGAQHNALTVASPTTIPADIQLGSAAKANPTYALQLDVSPIGGSIAGVTLNDYTHEVGSDARFTFDMPYENSVMALATRLVTINGAAQDISRSIWSVAQRGEGFVTLRLDITDGKNPLLTLFKRFTVRPRAEGGAAGAMGFDTELTCKFTNQTDSPMTVSMTLGGPTFPPGELARGGDRQVIAGYQGKNEVVLTHDATESFTAAAPSKEYSEYKGQPMLWFGAGGNYFNSIIRPIGAMWIKQASAKVVNPENEDPLQHEIVLAVDSNDIHLAPAGSETVIANVFFGPRRRSVLNSPYYLAPRVEYNQTLSIGGSSCAFCTFQWLVDLLMSLLGAFHFVLRDWGLSIIALVFVVRACLHPITKRSQINMQKMTKLGPEMEKLKKKYADDKEGLNKAMMQFYKNQGAAPVLGCLPMFLQMPIWIALYSGLSSTFELRQAPFLYGLTWVKDLAKPDHLVVFNQTYKILFLHIDGINLLPVLMAVAYFFQQKLQPKPPASTPEQKQQQKMMQWMTLLFPVMLYTSPAGLNLYIFTSAVFGIIENKIIRKHIAEREALQASGPTFVDGEIVRKEIAGPKSATAAKKGGFMGWFATLQEKAEQVRKDAEKKAQQKRR